MNIQRSDIRLLNEMYDTSALVNKYGNLYKNIKWDGQTFNLQAFRSFVDEFLGLDRSAQTEFVDQMIKQYRGSLKNIYDLGIWLKEQGIDKGTHLISVLRSLTK